MKFSAALVSVSTILTFGHVSARPLYARSNGTVKTMSTSQSSSSGALYFMTNEGQENFVVSADIGSDGKVSLARAVATGGSGAHGITSPNGPDALFSQGSVIANAASQMLAVVNAGSSTISLFSIDANSPSILSKVGNPISSDGEFPMSVAFNAAGTQLCVLNGGSVNGVNCYSVNNSTGLTPMTNSVRLLSLNQTNPATGPAGTASQLIFSEDGTSLIASIKGTPPTPGFLAVWAVAADGSLSADFQTVTPGTGGLLPFSMTVIPGKNAVLATDAGIGFDIFDFSGKNQSSVVPITGQGATCWSSFSNQTGNFYLTDVMTSMVTEVNVDDNLKGTIVKQYAQTAGSGTIDNEIASLGGQDFLYVLGPNATQIDVLSLNGAGQAQNIQTVDIAGPAQSVGLTVSQFNLQGMTSFVKN